MGLVVVPLVDLRHARRERAQVVVEEVVSGLMPQPWPARSPLHVKDTSRLKRGAVVNEPVRASDRRPGR